MNINFKGKTAIITGSIQGIGKHIALILAQAGATVVINSRRDAHQLDVVAGKIRETGSQVTAVVADVSRRDGAREVIHAAAEYGSIDILVNNAGGLVKRLPVAEFNEEHYQTVMG